MENPPLNIIVEKILLDFKTLLPDHWDSRVRELTLNIFELLLRIITFLTVTIVNTVKTYLGPDNLAILLNATPYIFGLSLLLLFLWLLYLSYRAGLYDGMIMERELKKHLLKPS
jgi:hypothetical protein